MLLELKVRIEIDVEENVVMQYGCNAHTPNYVKLLLTYRNNVCKGFRAVSSDGYYYIISYDWLSPVTTFYLPVISSYSKSS
jgi:hypothetical protein